MTLLLYAVKYDKTAFGSSDFLRVVYICLVSKLQFQNNNFRISLIN